MCARVNKSELFSCKQERVLTFAPYIIICYNDRETGNIYSYIHEKDAQ